MLSPHRPVPEFGFAEHRRLLELLFGGEHKLTSLGGDHIGIVMRKSDFQKWQQAELDTFVRQIF